MQSHHMAHDPVKLHNYGPKGPGISGDYFENRNEASLVHKLNVLQASSRRRVPELDNDVVEEGEGDSATMVPSSLLGPLHPSLRSRPASPEEEDPNASIFRGALGLVDGNVLVGEEHRFRIRSIAKRDGRGRYGEHEYDDARSVGARDPLMDRDDFSSRCDRADGPPSRRKGLSNGGGGSRKEWEGKEIEFVPDPAYAYLTSLKKGPAVEVDLELALAATADSTEAETEVGTEVETEVGTTSSDVQTTRERQRERVDDPLRQLHRNYDMDDTKDKDDETTILKDSPKSIIMDTPSRSRLYDPTKSDPIIPTSQLITVAPITIPPPPPPPATLTSKSPPTIPSPPQILSVLETIQKAKCKIERSTSSSSQRSLYYDLPTNRSELTSATESLSLSTNTTTTAALRTLPAANTTNDLTEGGYMNLPSTPATSAGGSMPTSSFRKMFMESRARSLSTATPASSLYCSVSRIDETTDEEDEEEEEEVMEDDARVRDEMVEHVASYAIANSLLRPVGGRSVGEESGDGGSVDLYDGNATDVRPKDDSGMKMEGDEREKDESDDGKVAVAEAESDEVEIVTKRKSRNVDDTPSPPPSPAHTTSSPGPTFAAHGTCSDPEGSARDDGPRIDEVRSERTCESPRGHGRSGRSHVHHRYHADGGRKRMQLFRTERGPGGRIPTLHEEEELYLKLADENDFDSFVVDNSISFAGDVLLGKMLRERTRIAMKRGMLEEGREMYVQVHCRRGRGSGESVSSLEDESVYFMI